MQDQHQNKKRSGGLQQEQMSTNPTQEQAGSVSSEETSTGNNEPAPEVDYPQQPRRQEEPIVGGGQNWGTNDSPTGVAADQTYSDHGASGRGNKGGENGQQGTGYHQGSMQDNKDAKRPTGNGGTSINQGSRTDQHPVNQENQSSRHTSNDDYRRNVIGKTDE